MSCLPLTQAVLDKSLESDHIEINKADRVGYLVIKDRQYEILLGETKIGRNASVCAIALENETVSQVHAVIESEGPEDSFLYDNNSTNGTKIGKMVLKPYCRYKISNNDIITLGDISSKFMIYSNSNYSSPTPLFTSKLGIQDVVEDKAVKKLSVEENDLNDYKTNKGIITEIFRAPSTIGFSKLNRSQKKSVNESSSIKHIVNKFTECDEVNPQKQIKQYIYLPNNSDISDEIFNETTQCEYTVNSDIFNLPTQCTTRQSTETLKTEELIKKTTSDFNVSSVLDHAIEIEKFSSDERESNDVDIFNCSTQFEIKFKDTPSHKTSNIELFKHEDILSNNSSNFNQILGKKLQIVNDSNNVDNNVKKEISECNENKSVDEKNELNNGNNNLDTCCDNENKEDCKVPQINSQNIAVTDREIHVAGQKAISKYVKLFHNNIPDEIFDLPTQVSDQDNELKNSVLCTENKETDNFVVLKNKSVDKSDPLFNTSTAVNFQVSGNKKILSTEVVNLKEDNIISKGKEDTYSLEEGKISSQNKVENQFLTSNNEEDNKWQVESHCKNELFSKEQKLHAVQTGGDSIIISQYSNVNAGNFESGNPGIEEQNCNDNELKLIDSSDETESDLEVKIRLDSSLKENSPGQGYFINSECDPSKHSDSISLIPGSENLNFRRSLSESSDRTVSDLDVIELQNGANFNLKIKDSEDFVDTNICLLDCDSRKSDENAPSDSNCCHFIGNSLIVEQIRNSHEKSVAVPLHLRQSPLKLSKSVSVNSDNNNTYLDAEKFNNIEGEISGHKTSEISTTEELKKENDDNSNESESLIKVIEDSSIFYDKILTSQNEDGISNFSKLPTKLETDADVLTKSDSSPTLLSSHPVFDALSEINDILSKKSSRESSVDDETKINEGFQVFVSEIPSKKPWLNAERARDFTPKGMISDSDETDCEAAESYIKDRKWKGEDDERARDASPTSMIEQISFHELAYNGDEIEYGHPSLQLVPTPEFKYESEINFLSDPENCENSNEKPSEPHGKRSVEKRIGDSGNLIHKNKIKKPSCKITSYFNVSKPDGMKINESPLKRARQMNSTEAVPEKKSKKSVRNFETGEVKIGSKKAHGRKTSESSLRAPESNNAKAKTSNVSCKKENSNCAPSRQSSDAETSTAQMRTARRERKDCRLLSEVDLCNIICPERDGFEISLGEEKEVEEEVKSNLRRRRSNADYFSCGSGKRRRMRTEQAAREAEPKSSFTKIAFTGIESASYSSAVTKLGGEVVSDLKEGHVLVTDRARRTVKFLCAVARGIPVVSPKWLIASEKKLRLLDPWSFLLKDSKAEKTWDFNLKASLDKARKQKLLHGYSVFATQSTKPPVPEILDVVTCCGGTPLIYPPEAWPEKSIVLTCNEDKTSWPPRKHRHVKVVHYEIILDGVLKQLIDFKTYKLR